MEDLDKNSLLYWFPRIRNLDIPIPKTETFPLTTEEKYEYYNGEMEVFNLNRILQEIRNGILSRFSLPVFIRTDQYSGKHFWKKTCYVNDIEKLELNLTELVISHRLADFIGLPLEAIVVREFIPMDTRFIAFSGEMPVNPERRYFIKAGGVLCHHPYWVQSAITVGTSVTSLPQNLEDLVKEMNTEREEEINLLSSYSKKVAEVFNGYWSVDFCRAKDGRWILIDMADGEKSWHPQDCENSTMLSENN